MLFIKSWIWWMLHRTFFMILQLPRFLLHPHPEHQKRASFWEDQALPALYPQMRAGFTFNNSSNFPPMLPELSFATWSRPHCIKCRFQQLTPLGRLRIVLWCLSELTRMVSQFYFQSGKLFMRLAIASFVTNHRLMLHCDTAWKV